MIQIRTNYGLQGNYIMEIKGAESPKWTPGALLRCVSGRVYEVIRREKYVYQNYGLGKNTFVGSILGGGLFVRLSGVRGGCQTCQKPLPFSNAELGRVGWISNESAFLSTLISLPKFPDSFEEWA